MNRNILLFLIIASLVRLTLALLFPLTADESYYWLWSKHLSLSYVDHPPMIALVNYLMTFGTENLFMIRFGAVLITLLVSIIIYLLTREIFNEKIAFWSAVLFQLLPHFVIVWLTQFVELPLALFWTLALWILARIIKTQKKAYWYLLALTLGLGYLSKYTMFLFWPCLVIFLLISPEHRVWLKKKELYLCLLLSVLFFIPVLYWNSQHGWVSFTFHSGKATAEAWGANVPPFIGDQLVHFTPFLLFALYNVGRYSLKKNSGTKLLFAFSFPVLLLFLLLSVKVKIWAHWPSTGYIAAIPLTVAYLIDNGKSLKKFITWISLFTLLILIILFWVSPGILLHQKDYAKNYKLAEIVPKEYKLFAKTNVSASLLEFYLKRQTYLATGFLKPHPIWGEKQYELWGTPNLIKGETALYYGEDSPFFREKTHNNFTKVSEISGFKLYLIEDYITNNYKMFKLEGFKGKGLHP
jgi:4-amino-4-deoxy-L-arabinose transferase-like glycosyltransferase